MERDTFYIKCRKTKENPYGLKEVSTDLSLDKPTLISIVPVATQERDLNGAINVAGRAVGFAGKTQEMSQLVDYYSWNDIENMGLQFVSASIYSPKAVYEKYFRPILFDKNGSYKSIDQLAQDMRKINIVCYCAATKDIAQIANLMEQDLQECHKFSQKQIDFIMQQVCAVDVTTREKLGTAKFTTVHLFSQSDNDLMYPQDIASQTCGIKLLGNGHEATVIVDRLNIEDEADHTYRDFFELGGDKTQHGQIVSIISNIVVSNMLQHSMSDKTLSGNNMEELSFIFNDDIQNFFNGLLNQNTLTNQDFKRAISHLQLSRALPEQYIKAKYDILKDEFIAKNLAKYTDLRKNIIDKLDQFGDYITLFEKFVASDGYANLSDIQKDIFAEVRKYCSYSIVILQEYIKQLALLSFDSRNMEDITKMTQFLAELEEDVKKIEIGRVTKTKSVMKAYDELERYRNGDKSAINQWGSEEKVTSFYYRTIENLDR